MQFDEYQRQAKTTDRNPESIEIPLFGLVGEAGTLLSEYKKLLRDGGAHARFREQVAEELGDLLWYIANLAEKFELDLDVIAQRNLEKTSNRWSPPPEGPSLLDEDCEPEEQLPREFVFTLAHEEVDGQTKLVVRDEAGDPVGDPLTDNAYHDDGYRFHDALHFAFAAKLGWSPVLRKLLKRKRKSRKILDEVEDGARAAALEEMIAALIGEYALRHRFLDGTSTVDWDLLRMAKRLTTNLRVGVRTEAEWEDAIVTGIHVWKQLRDARGGTVRGSLLTRTLEVV